MSKNEEEEEQRRPSLSGLRPWVLAVLALCVNCQSKNRKLKVTWFGAVLIGAVVYTAL